jgi:hypothetical protein
MAWGLSARQKPGNRRLADVGEVIRGELDEGGRSRNGSGKGEEAGSVFP